MTEVIDPRHMEMNPAFPSFTNLVHRGDRVYVAAAWLDQAVSTAARKRLKISPPTIRVLEMTSDVDDLDFHLTFCMKANRWNLTGPQ